MGRQPGGELQHPCRALTAMLAAMLPRCISFAPPLLPGIVTFHDILLQLGEVARSFYNLARRVKDSEPKGLTKHTE